MTHESQFPTEPGHEGNSAEEEPKWNPSESQDYPVSCPNCGKETPFVLWVMLNTKENPEEAKQLAIEFYGPIFLMYSLYDNKREEDDLAEMLKKHVDRFSKKMDSY